MNTLKLITRTLRRLNIIAQGQTPDEAMLDDALVSLEGLYSRLRTEGIFGDTTIIQASGGDYTDVDETTRFISATSVTPLDVVPDLTLLTLQDPSESRVDHWLFDAQDNEWRKLNGLQMTDEAPLSSRDPDGLSSLLARQIAGDYALEPRQQMVFEAVKFRKALIMKWHEPRATRTGGDDSEPTGWDYL